MKPASGDQALRDIHMLGADLGQAAIALPGAVFRQRSSVRCQRPEQFRDGFGHPRGVTVELQ